MLKMLILVHKLKCVGVWRQLRLEVLRKLLRLHLFCTAWVGVGVLKSWVVVWRCLDLKFDIISWIHMLPEPMLTVEGVNTLRARYLVRIRSWKRRSPRISYRRPLQPCWANTILLHDIFDLHLGSLFAGYGYIVIMSALSYIIAVTFMLGAIYA